MIFTLKNFKEEEKKPKYVQKMYLTLRREQVFSIYLHLKERRSVHCQLSGLTCSVRRDGIYICILSKVGNSGPEFSFLFVSTTLHTYLC